MRKWLCAAVVVAMALAAHAALPAAAKDFDLQGFIDARSGWTRGRLRR